MLHSKLAIVLLLTPFALACSHEERAPAPTEREAVQTPSTPRLSASQTAIALERLPQPDRDFVKQLASANLAAIRLGELAANRGSSIEVRSLGREMVDTHTALSDQLRTSARTEGITLPMARLTDEQAQMYKELSALSGPRFDDAFARDVMALQKEAIANFEYEAEHGRLSELAMLANETLPLVRQRVRTVQNQLQRM
jgi:putative membrane protein